LAEYTIGVISDLHLGTWGSFSRVHHAAKLLAAEHVKAVIVAGDLTSTPEAELLIDDALSPIRNAYGVLGNWDYRYPPSVRRQTAIRLLMNEGVLVAPGLWIGGIDDGLLGKPDIDQAMAGAPHDSIRILIAHEPELADYVKEEHRITLQISGHSHGGQVCLPGWGPVLLPRMSRKYHTGFNRAPHCWVYTSRGIGMSHLPFRVLCPPQVTILTLTKT
jgi:predicted MPP superfamily phosphohydrolase